MVKKGLKILENRFEEKIAIFQPKHGSIVGIFNGYVSFSENGEDVGWTNRSKAFDTSTGDTVFTSSEQHELRADYRLLLKKLTE